MYKKLDEQSLNTILEAGIQSFSQKGLDKTTMSDVAKEAGFSVGVIYKYFKDKDDFFLACVKHSLELLDEVLAKAVNNEDDVMRAIENVLRSLIEQADSHANYNAMYNEITSGSCRKFADILAKEIEERSARLYAELFKKGQKQGVIKTTVDPGMNAFFFDSMLITLQFSYCCDYYKERLKIFCGDDILDDDEKMISSFMGFMKAALMIS